MDHMILDCKPPQEGGGNLCIYTPGIWYYMYIVYLVYGTTCTLCTWYMVVSTGCRNGEGLCFSLSLSSSCSACWCHGYEGGGWGAKSKLCYDIGM